MQFYFIRHGQSTNNALWARQGSNDGRSQDPELTEAGVRQAELVARFLCRNGPLPEAVPYDPKNVTGFGITHLYCSPMVRAVATGTHIAQALGLPLAAWKDLHETGGIFLDDPETGERVGLPGKAHAFFRQHYPHLVLADDMDPQGWWNRPFEEREERQPRAVRVARTLLERHGGTDDHVAVVSHGGFYNHLLCAVLDLPRRDDYWFIMNNAGITRIDFAEERTRVIYMNRTDFLPDDLIT